ncbi:MAG: hypothetical protein M1401_04135 [Chloroflexi bacterium]|nr:hypothetical protein [Chloroflexota bacterium]
MDLKQHRKRCEARLRGLTLLVPFDVRSFCRSLAAQRGRPLLLHPLASQAGPCGLWVAGPTADYIFYEEETSPLHQDHIILHEASHLLCGHHPAPVSETEFSGLLFPNLAPKTVKAVLARAGYSLEDEREAELLASLILERAGAGRPANGPGVDSETEGILRRLEASLETGTNG